MDQREQQRRAFAEQSIGGSADEIVRASEDASFRSYWRVRAGSDSWILMDAPPALEDCRPFVEIAERLRTAGLHPPLIHAQDLAQGFLLLEDLGDELFADRLDERTAEALYGQAFTALGTLARMDTRGLPPYDADRLLADLELFPEWYVARQLGMDGGGAFRRWWDPLAEELVAAALAQPQVFVHRDFHCGNLMPGPGQPAILDFQDAVAGPFTYDLISLLQDRYIAWPRPQLLRWSEGHRRSVAPEVSAAIWQRWVDWMGLQRNLKVVGIFARLNFRDGKPRYLAWQPRFLGYVRETAARYPEFAPLSRFLASVGDPGPS